MKNTYVVKMEIKEEEFNNIMKELEDAREKIYECYNRLKLMGIVVNTNPNIEK